MRARGGSQPQTAAAGTGVLTSSTAPGAARSSTSARPISRAWCTPTKPACRIRYGAAIGSGPNRRCDTVSEPDFLES